MTAHTLGEQGDWVAIWTAQLATLESVADFALMLARKHRVLVFEGPAVGYNAHLPYTNEVNELVYYAHRVITHLGIERLHWVGHSAGGVVGAALACAAPQVFDSLTLISTPLISQGRLKAHLSFAKNLLAGSKLGRRLIVSRLVKDVGFRDESEQQRVSSYFRQLLEEVPTSTISSLHPISGASVRRVFERLRSQTLPMLVIAGEYDPVVLLRDQRTVAELTQARFVQVQSGHMTLLMQPDVCAHAFERFMEYLNHPGSRPAPLSRAA